MKTAIIETEQRPWGKYEVLLDAKDCKVKRITVIPGGQLSLQYHNQRMEDWIVVSGKAAVTIGPDVIYTAFPASVHIEQGVTHRVTNDNSEDYVFIEVQRGAYFGEDDIVRLEDKYNRA